VKFCFMETVVGEALAVRAREGEGEDEANA
jgi:hypothetical protein